MLRIIFSQKLKCLLTRMNLAFFFRAYRIGQGRNVRVFRLVCSGTIEENIYLRQVYKQVVCLMLGSLRNVILFLDVAGKGKDLKKD